MDLFFPHQHCYVLVVSVRLNPAEVALMSQFIAACWVGWCPDGLYLLRKCLKKYFSRRKEICVGRLLNIVDPAWRVYDYGQWYGYFQNCSKLGFAYVALWSVFKHTCNCIVWWRTIRCLVCWCWKNLQWHFWEHVTSLLKGAAKASPSQQYLSSLYTVPC